MTEQNEQTEQNQEEKTITSQLSRVIVQPTREKEDSSTPLKETSYIIPSQLLDKLLWLINPSMDWSEFTKEKASILENWSCQTIPRTVLARTNDYVLLRKEKFNSLINSSLELDAYLDAGIDNWEWSNEAYCEYADNKAENKENFLIKACEKGDLLFYNPSEKLVPYQE